MKYATQRLHEVLSAHLFPRCEFGAGNIVSVSAIEGKNFRHGDIEDVLEDLHMRNSGGFLGLGGGKKFDRLSIKRVYFGNFLRDYSQAVDVGTLERGISLETIRVLVWVLAFMSFGYGTEEFEVTVDRLGCYRPEVHLDNPLGYETGRMHASLIGVCEGLWDPTSSRSIPGRE